MANRFLERLADGPPLVADGGMGVLVSSAAPRARIPEEANLRAPETVVKLHVGFIQAGADLIDVSAGQTWADAQPIYGRMFQTPFSDKIRNEAKLATMAVGNITDADQANAILASGRADLVALARPHLIDPSWTLRAAAAASYRDVHVPPPYLAGMAQLARNLQREAEMQAAVLKA